MAKEKKQVPAGVRIERSIFNRAEKMRMEELKKGNPIAMSSQSWFSSLVKDGMGRL